MRRVCGFIAPVPVEKGLRGRVKGGEWVGRRVVRKAGWETI